jgi:hypothetical protein
MHNKQNTCSSNSETKNKRRDWFSLFWLGKNLNWNYLEVDDDDDDDNNNNNDDNDGSPIFKYLYNHIASLVLSLAFPILFFQLEFI